MNESGENQGGAQTGGGAGTGAGISSAGGVVTVTPGGGTAEPVTNLTPSDPSHPGVVQFGTLTTLNPDPSTQDATLSSILAEQLALGPSLSQFGGGSLPNDSLGAVNVPDQPPGGINVGVIILLLAVVGAGVYWYRHRKKNA